MSENLGLVIRGYLEERHEEMVSFLTELAAFETPSTEPETVAPALDFQSYRIADHQQHGDSEQHSDHHDRITDQFQQRL